VFYGFRGNIERGGSFTLNDQKSWGTHTHDRHSQRAQRSHNASYHTTAGLHPQKRITAELPLRAMRLQAQNTCGDVKVKLNVLFTLALDGSGQPDAPGTLSPPKEPPYVLD
jgi:hypothetical protein